MKGYVIIALARLLEATYIEDLEDRADEWRELVYNARVEYDQLIDALKKQEER